MHIQTIFKIVNASFRNICGVRALPPHDLSSSDFFLWGHLKVHVYGNNLYPIDDLEAKIKYENKIISFRTLRGIASNVAKHICDCFRSLRNYYLLRQCYVSFPSEVWVIIQFYYHDVSQKMFFYFFHFNYNLYLLFKELKFLFHFKTL